jgi:hypothetical protein
MVIDAREVLSLFVVSHTIDKLSRDAIRRIEPASLICLVIEKNILIRTIFRRISFTIAHRRRNLYLMEESALVWIVDLQYGWTNAAFAVAFRFTAVTRHFIPPLE